MKPLRQSVIDTCFALDDTLLIEYFRNPKSIKGRVCEKIGAFIGNIGNKLQVTK